MCNGPILKNIIIFTIPLVLTGVLQLMFNAADLVVVGRFCGSDSIAAVGSTGSIINLLVNLFMGLSAGVSVSVAHALGANDKEATHKVVHTAMLLSVISGTIITVSGLLFSKSMLYAIGTPSEVIDLSNIYLKIYFCGMISSMVYNYGAAILRSAGDTQGPLIYLTISGVLNLIMNLFFVTLIKMDVAGVALATTISQTVSAVLIVIALKNRTDGCRLYLRKLRIYKNQLIKILKIGVPAGVQSSLFSISNVLIQSSINSFGVDAVSGNAAAVNLEGFIFTTLDSVANAGLTFAGQNFGAKKIDRVKKTAITCVGLNTAIGLVLGICALIFARPLLGIYITDSQNAIDNGFSRIKIFCLAYCLGGVMNVVSGILRGIGSSVLPMAVTIGGVCLFRVVWIFTIFQIPEFHTLTSLYISYPISYTITLLVQAVALILILRKLNKKTAVD